MAWQDHAACRGMKTDLFFPETGYSSIEAKAACAGCPVRGRCYTHALVQERYGIWGGTSERERERERKRVRRQRQACA